MRDIVFVVTMLSLPAAAAVIAGKTLFSVHGMHAEIGAAAATRELGEEVYAAECAACHGADVSGTEAGPSLLGHHHRRDRMNDAAMATAIRHGVPEPEAGYPPMPAFRALPEAEIDSVLRFIRARQGEAG